VVVTKLQNLLLYQQRSRNMELWQKCCQEPVNEGADVLADNAISDPKAGMEWCRRTNGSIFTWENPVPQGRESK